MADSAMLLFRLVTQVSDAGAGDSRVLSLSKGAMPAYASFDKLRMPRVAVRNAETE